MRSLPMLILVLLLAGCAQTSAPVTSGSAGAPGTPSAPLPPVNKTFDGTFEAGTGVETPAASGCSGSSGGVAADGSSFEVEVPEGYRNATVTAQASSPSPAASWRLCLFHGTGNAAYDTVTGAAPLALNATVAEGTVVVALYPDNTKPEFVAGATFHLAITLLP